MIHGDVSNNNNSWVIVSGGKITQILVKGVYNGDEVDAEFGDVGAVADATVALADTHWEYTYTVTVDAPLPTGGFAEMEDEVTFTLSFNANGYIYATLHHTAHPDSGTESNSYDDGYKWELVEGENGNFNLKLTYVGDWEMGECGVEAATANDGSFITFENGEITGFTFNFFRAAGDTELVQMQPATGMGPRSK